MVNEFNDTSGNNTITLSACTNSLSACGGPVLISGPDTAAYAAWVQVRPDGGITVSYVDRLGSANTLRFAS